MIKRVQIKTLIILVVILAIFSLLPTNKTNAGLGLPFGGRITSMVPCTCNGIGSQVTIKGGRFSGTYLYDQIAVRKYSHYFLSPGRWVLGDYTPGGECLQAPPPCVPLIITKGTITRTGISF
jgi:hypothetical protein